MAKEKEISQEVKRVNVEASAKHEVKPEVQVKVVQKGIEVKVPAGHYEVAALDENGNEKPNSSFFVKEKTFYKAFNNPNKFVIKKKAQ